MKIPPSLTLPLEGRREGVGVEVDNIVYVYFILNHQNRSKADMEKDNDLWRSR